MSDYRYSLSTSVYEVSCAVSSSCDVYKHEITVLKDRKDMWQLVAQHLSIYNSILMFFNILFYSPPIYIQDKQVDREKSRPTVRASHQQQRRALLCSAFVKTLSIYASTALPPTFTRLGISLSKRPCRAPLNSHASNLLVLVVEGMEGFCNNKIAQFNASSADNAHSSAASIQT